MVERPGGHTGQSPKRNHGARTAGGTELEKPRSSSDPVSEKSRLSKYLNRNTLFSVFDPVVTVAVMLEDPECRGSRLCGVFIVPVRLV